MAIPQLAFQSRLIVSDDGQASTVRERCFPLACLKDSQKR